MPSKAYKTKLTRAQDRRAKTTDEQVKEMRELYAKGAKPKAIAEKYGLSTSTVRYIVSEKARETLAKYRKENPPKRRTKEEAAAYMRDLRKYKMSIYRERKELERRSELCGMMKYIPNWADKNLKCHFCGTHKSVKYAVTANGKEVCACNRCVLLHDHQTEKGEEQE